MDITCPACQSRFTLKTDRLPRGPFRVVCGKCRHSFQIDPPRASGPVERTPGSGQGIPALGERPPPPPVVSVGGRGVPDGPEGGAQEETAPHRTVAGTPPAASGQSPSEAWPASAASSGPGMAPPVEEFEEDLRLALCCDSDPERLALCKAALQELGYKVHVAPGGREALAWMYQNRYELVLLHEDFTAGPAGKNEVLAGLQGMPMQLRRQMCVGLCGKGLRTMDNLTAFHRSVNFVVAQRDLVKARTIFRSAVADNEQFYRVYKETMRQLGKV